MAVPASELNNTTVKSDGQLTQPNDVFRYKMTKLFLNFLYQVALLCYFFYSNK